MNEKKRIPLSKMQVETERARLLAERDRLLAAQEKLLAEHAEIFAGLEEAAEEQRAEADKRIGDPKSYAAGRAKRLSQAVREYETRDVSSTAKLFDDTLTDLREATPSPELRNLAKKVLVILSKLATQTYFPLDVDESRWDEMLESAAAAFETQWDPEEELTGEERQQLIKIVFAHELSGRNEIVPLDMHGFAEALTKYEDELEQLAIQLDSSDLDATSPLRLAVAVSKRDLPAIIKAVGGEPETADQVIQLVIAILDWGMDEQVNFWCRKGLEMDPNPFQKEMFQDILGDLP